MWLFFGKISLLLLSFITMSAFSRWLTPETYGAYQFVIAIATILAIWTLPGMDMALIRAIAQKKDGIYEDVFHQRLLYGLFSAFFALGICIWYFVNNNTTLGITFAIIATLLPLREASMSYWHYWTGRQSFGKQSLYQLTSASITTLCLLTAAFYTNSLPVLVTVFFGVQALLDYVFYKLTLSSLRNNDKDSSTINYGKQLTLMRVISTIANQIDKIIIWKILGPAAVATYVFALEPINKVRNVLPIQYLALPKLSEKPVAERKDNLFYKFMILVALCAAGILTIIVSAPLFFSVAFPNYVHAVPYLQWLSLTLFIIPFSLLNSALTAEVRTRELFIIQILVPLTKIFFLLFCIPLWGIWGAVIALLAGALVNCLSTLYYFIKM